MCGRMPVGTIRGKVSLDSSKPLSDVGVRLYAAVGERSEGAGDGEILIRREKLLSDTKTNEKGEYSFPIRRGSYTVSLDAGSLPAGTCAACVDKPCESGKTGSVDFAVTESEPRTENTTRSNRETHLARGVCPADMVRLARNSGIIDECTEIEYLLKALFDRNRLPKEYRSRIPIKSGTGHVEYIQRYIARADADPAVAETARQMLAASVPKLDKLYRSPGGHFNIHYTLKGENASAPLHIEQAGQAFDNVRAFTCTLRGYREPLLNKGSDAYDVYVFDLKGKYGVTYSTKTYKIRNSGVSVASGFICIDNDYSREKGFEKSREDCLKVTAAHEFFHAVQYAYNADADGWWKEASATWNEDEVYTGVNDYVRYIPKYLSAPDKSLDQSSYSGVIFAKFLSQNYSGGSIIKHIWEKHATGVSNSIQAIDRVIREDYDGQGIASAFNRFSAWNVNPAQYYKEGALWKTSAAVSDTWSTYPTGSRRGSLDHLSSNYLSFKPGGSPEDSSLLISVEGAERAKWGFKLQKRKRNEKTYEMTDMITDGSSAERTVITVRNFGGSYEDICLIPSNLDNERDKRAYSYSADITGKV